MKITEYDSLNDIKNDDYLIIFSQNETKKIEAKKLGGGANKDIYKDNAISLGRSAKSVEGYKSIAFGENVEASGRYCQALGYETIASDWYSHAEGDSTQATGSAAHSEGVSTKANGNYSHAEGIWTQAKGMGSHAEGNNGYANGTSSHHEGSNNWADGNASHAEGNTNRASGHYSHAEGSNTIAGVYSSHSSGVYNRQMNGETDKFSQEYDAFVIGNGDSDNRSNAFRVTFSGETYGLSNFNSSGADYAEFIKEWYDGNPENEDRVGYFVTVKNKLLYKANPGDYICGITSGNPSIVGNGDEEYYWKYERDEFNRIIWEDIPEIIYTMDEKTGKNLPIETGKMIPNGRMKINKKYDPSLQETYVERKNRPEWNYVGMKGMIPVRDDGTCLPDHFCKCGENGIATLASDEEGMINRFTYRVIERISANVVLAIL